MTPRPDSIMALALTIVQEAGGESFLGKLAVGHTIMNRAEAENRSISDVIFQSKQFTAWEGDSPTRLRLDTVDYDGEEWRDSYAAACGAYFRRLLGVPDITLGANHYLNVEETRRIRGDGTLPKWHDPRKVTIREGRHEFLRL